MSKNHPVKSSVKAKTMYNVSIPTKGKTEKRPVKNSVNVTQGTMLFFQRKVRLKLVQSKFPLRLPVYNTFSLERVGMKITQSKVALTIHWEQRIFHPVEMVINTTPGTMLFLKERGRLKLTQSIKNSVNCKQGTSLLSRGRIGQIITRSKIALTIPSVRCYFPRESNTKIHPVKNTVYGTKSITLFCQGRIRVKASQTKIALTVHMEP